MASDYQRIALAIEYIGRRWNAPPSLDEVAAHVGLSSFHFQRLFRLMTGISPKRYSQSLVGDLLERRLKAGDSVLRASAQAGLSSPSRTHELMVNLRAMTPGEWGRGGATLTLRYGVHPTPLGPCLVAVTPRGVCELRFVDPCEDVAAQLTRQWPSATIQRSPHETQPVAESLLTASRKPGPITLHVRGTNFQLRVWKALLDIPAGVTASYQEIGEAIGAPRATRAVGNAVGRNPIAILIPCHRVLRANGALGGYRWGMERKRSLLTMESLQGQGS